MLHCARRARSLTLIQLCFDGKSQHLFSGSCHEAFLVGNQQLKKQLREVEEVDTPEKVNNIPSQNNYRENVHRLMMHSSARESKGLLFPFVDAEGNITSAQEKSPIEI